VHGEKQRENAAKPNARDRGGLLYCLCVLRVSMPSVLKVLDDLPNVHAFTLSVSGARREAMAISVSVSAISSVDTALTSGLTATLIIE